MKSFRISDLMDATGARVLRGDLGAVAGGTNTDTRKIQRGDAFFALSGLNHDGNRFALDAWNKGACAVVLEDRASAYEIAAALPPEALVLVAADTRHALGD